MIVIGIDPGLTGAIAFLDADGQVIAVDEMPVMAIPEAGPKTTIKTEVDAVALWKLIRTRVPRGVEAIAVMEHTSSVGQVGQEQAKLSLAAGKATCMAVLRLAQFDVRRVTPVMWKRFYGIKQPLPGSKSPDQKKQALALARGFYGVGYLKLEKHHNRADALLIARWALRKIVEPEAIVDPLEA
jgi:hypothetical protein